MATIALFEFGGMLPRLGEEFLPDVASTKASNCDLLSGELRPMHQRELLFDFVPPSRLRSHAGEVKE